MNTAVDRIETDGLLMNRVKLKILYVFLCLSGMMLSILPVRAEESSEMPPHLIQSVSDQDIYEGLVALGMLECPVLEAPDCEKAYENVRNCVVRVNMGNAYGSGIVWQLTENAVIVATNEHVLEYWDDSTGFLYFPQGYYANARILGVSKEYDVGFLIADRDYFSYEELQKLQYACVEEAVYGELKPGDAMFCVGSGAEVGTTEYHEGTMEDAWYYVDIFENDMLYGYGFAKAGMSGGGTFDGYGHLIGMISGGTQRNETASVPLPSIMAAYEEITGEAAT